VIIGVGGGASVKAADDCSNAGLTLPLLPAETRQTLKDIHATETGYIFKNPVDMVPFMGLEVLANAIGLIADCNQLDSLIIHVAFDTWSMMDRKYATGAYIDSIISLKGIISKPVVVVLHYQAADRAKQLAAEAHARLREAGFPVYPSISRAASAISKFIQYHEHHQGGR